MKNPPKDCLQREVFTISRELEYYTADELEKQTGYGREEWWPGVIGKETIDNALDACEQAEVSPEITVQFQGHKLDIRDNGGGIPPETVERQVDYSSRTSDKLGYVSPTRGAQGNAWKTILAMPYVLDGERARPIIIEALRRPPPDPCSGRPDSASAAHRLSTPGDSGKNLRHGHLSRARLSMLGGRRRKFHCARGRLRRDAQRLPQSLQRRHAAGPCPPSHVCGPARHPPNHRPRNA